MVCALRPDGSDARVIAGSPACVASIGPWEPGGHIVVLSPAHQWLFSEFDKSIGHVRRYDKRNLRSLMPSGWTEKKLAYLDSVGVLLSLANALALRQALPSRLQLSLWDRLCVPLSRIVDRVLLGNCGKSILAVWEKRELK